MRQKPLLNRWGAIFCPADWCLLHFSRSLVGTVDGMITNAAFHNFSQRSLTAVEKELLGLGLKFLPVPPPMSPRSIREEYVLFSRLLKLKWFFGPRGRNQDWVEKSYDPFHLSNSFWVPDKKYQPLADIIDEGERILEQRISATDRQFVHPLPPHLAAALWTLRADETIVIKPADKNLSLTVLDKSWYLEEGER